MQQDATKVMANGGDMKTTKTYSKPSLRAKMRKMGDGGDNSTLTDKDGNVLPDTGSSDWDNWDASGKKKQPGSKLSSDSVGAAAGVLDTGINLLSPKDNYGVQSNAGAIASGAVKDAAIGFSVAGPIGAGVGAVVGGAMGYFGNKKAQKAKTQSIHAQGQAEEQMRLQRSGSIIAADPDLKYGNKDASYYAMGGTMKGTLPQPPRLKKEMPAVQPKQRLMPPVAEVPGRQISRMAKGGITPPAYDLRKLNKPYAAHVARIPAQNLSKMGDGGSGIHIKKSHEGLFTKYKERTGKTTAEALHSPDPHVRKMANFARNAAGWKKGANGGEVFKTTDPSYKYPQYVMGATGGDLKTLSAGNSKVEGRSHADGGVKFPAAGVELEGDETMNGDFVFSKKLGFAQQHEKIARNMAKVEKKPDTVVNRNTMNALQRQTEALKLQQESSKKAMGIPNELDNQSQQTQMATGGKLKGKYSHEIMHMEDTNPGKMAKGGSLRNKMQVMAEGGGTGPNDPKPGSGVSDHLKAAWNNFIDYAKSRGMSGNTQLDNRDTNLGKSLVDDYTKLHPTTVLKYDSIPVIQKELQNYRQQAWQRVQDKTATTDAKSYDEFMPNLSQVDGWLGSKTSQARFPSVIMDGKNVGFSDPNKTAVQQAQPKMANGGKLKKMATGGPNDNDVYGNGELPVASAGVTPYTQASLTNTSLPDSVPTLTAPPAGQQAKNPNGIGKSRLIDKINDIGDKVVPFLPNLYEAARKLPLPPTPVMESEIAPSLVDYSASRAEAVRQTRGANRAAEENLNTGAAVTASRAANLAQQERAVAGINEAEQTTNAGIRNQTNQVNLAVRARNNSLLNQHQQELVQRQLKGQELTQQNLASVSEKIQGMKRDASAKGLDEQRLMIEALKDNTGASYRGARSIFARNLNKDDMAQLDKHFKEMADQDREDRKNNTMAQRVLLSKIKNGESLTDGDKTMAQILLGKSAVATEDDLKKAKQASTRSSEQR